MFARASYFLYLFAVFSFAVLFWSNRVPWDPCAYMLTGSHLLGNSTYFEALRAPITSLIYGVFGVYGFFLVSILLLAYAVYIYAERNYLRSLVFVALLLPAFSWPYYVLGGSEILSLAFLLLGAAYSKRSWAGAVFSLAFLSRYTYLFFIPFFLPWSSYRERPRLALAHLVGFSLPVLIWSAVQWVMFGHPLASYIDFALINTHSDAVSPSLPRFDLLLSATFPSILLAVPGISIHTLLFIVLASFLAPLTAVPQARYYLPVLIPASLAASRWIKGEKKILLLAFANLMLAVFVVFPSSFSGNAEVYRSIATKVDPNCAYMSNVWVPLICVGVNALVPPPPDAYFDALKEGHSAIILMGVGHPAYMEDINQYIDRNIPIVRYDGFFLAGEGCAPLGQEDALDYWQIYSKRLQMIINKWLSSLLSDAPNPRTASNLPASTSDT